MLQSGVSFGDGGCRGQFGIMSRRKQANPRPIQVFEGKNGTEEDSIKNTDLEQNKDEMKSLQPLNVDVNLPTQFHSSLSVQSNSNSEDGMSRVASPGDNPSSLLTSPSTPSSSPTLDQPLLNKLKDASKILPIAGRDGRSTYICPMCQEHLSSNHDLTVHIRMHNAGNQMSQNNTCTICNKILSSQSSLDRHMLVHSGERPFKCKICAMTFTTNGNMHRHSRIHQKNGTGVGSPRTHKRSNSKSAWKEKLFSTSTDETDLDEAMGKHVPEKQEESSVLTKSAPPNLDWTRDAQKPSILHKNKIMPGYMPRPIWPPYPPYMPLMRPPFPIYPDMSMSFSPYNQQLPCPLCSKHVLLVDYMTHLKTEHNHENPFLNTPLGKTTDTPSKDDFSNEEPIKEEKGETEEMEETGGTPSSSPTPSPTPSQSSSPSPSPKSTKSGFEDIDFIDFTTPKFPLVAKTWCEQHERNAGNTQQEFICKECGKAFPCNSALMLHTDSHLESRSHEASEIQSDDVLPRKLGEENKNSFLSMLDLKPKESEIDNAKVSVKIEKMDEESQNSPAVTPTKETSDINQPHTAINYFKGLFPFNVSNMPLSGQRSMLHADSPLAVSTSPASSILSGDGTGSCGDVHDGKATGLLCKFCEMVFPNQKTLNAHKRIHMGLSPYQCSMCNYSSADKSTLIRHFRTHNGERPFQCIICDYAFTTKANCERHVKKKHLKTEKQEIEKSIGYNKYTTSERERNQINSFHSPDTVCKYCGEDFKFFRALKHHLRSHSSCRLKPFLCQKCQVGFSTKANCVRHIQKQHTEIDQSDIEQLIQVNELTTAMDIDSDSSQSDNNNLFPQNHFVKAPPSASPSTHPAFNTGFTPLIGQNLLKHEISRSEAPLDFSVKREDGGLSKSRVCHDTSDINDNEPMDLSVKKEYGTPEEKKLKQTEISPIHHYQCPFCLRSFAVRSELSLHVQQVHDITPEKDTNNNRKWLQETSTPRKLPIMPYPIHPAFAKYSPYPNQAISALFSPGFDMNSDLAPVNRMLTAAQSQNFKSFLNQSRENELSNHTLGSNVDEEDNDVDNIGCDSDVFSDVEDNSLDKTDNVNINTTPRPDNSNDVKTKSLELPDTGVKKKRNSYADSPHKLNCPYCPRSFPWVSSLNRHLLTHTGQKPFKCSRCPVTFSTKSNRERHLIRKHGVNMLDPASRLTMDRPYKCHLCVFSSFATKSNLLKHYSDRHPENPVPERLSRCDISDMETHQSQLDDSLNENMIINDDSKISYDETEETSNDLEPGSVSPEDKDDVIVISPRLEEHTTKEAPLSDDDDVNNNVDPFVFSGSAEKHINPERDNYNVDKITNCWKCSEEFVSRKLLVRHLKEHNIDLPYKCYLCDASFDVRIECLKHKEKNHASDWSILHEKNGVKNIDEFSSQIDNMVSKSSALDFDVETKDLSINMAIESSRADVLTADYFQRKVYCSLCPKRFWSLQDLRRHMRSHTGERPFECDICHKRFTLKHSMMRHRRKHGNNGLDSTLDDTDNYYTDEPPSGSFYSPRVPVSVTMPQVLPYKQEIDNVITRHKLDTSDDNQSEEGESPDILQNLLGVDTTALNTMLDLKNSLDSTTQLLGMADNS
ncbi:ras-responsive element-binding protein 1 isoform X2 [Patella vulgata]|uniref:ras-responsive element-binding protein 1 isoform X2 n=1 Tax=Patella vulgata TaxID=6465 RepID=UPI00217FA399|nr:ras-responsive element-binding protein 1 isoform X2 [Patella vulgata]